MVTLSTSLAKQFREVYLNGTWIANTNLKAELNGLSWKTATRKIGELNSIAALSFHLHYYVAGLLNVFEGGTLDIKDKYSFDLPPITSQQDWEELQSRIWRDTERFAEHLDAMSDDKLFAPFIEKKYGNYHRNITGMIEHSYYHLGQIVLIKKMLQQEK